MSNINIEVLLTAKDKASAVLKNFGAESEKLGKTAGTFLKENVVQLGAAFAGVTAIMYDSIKSYQESELALTQLDAVLKSTNQVAGVTQEEALKLAEAFQNVTMFSDEAVLSAENILLTFTNIGKDIFPTALETVLDMSQALGQDLKSSSIQLGKALQDPILGITALRRVGVNFNETQAEMIKGLVESGRILDAQKAILQELQVEFGNSAGAAGSTFAGQIQILKNNIDNLKETIGGGLIKTLQELGVDLITISMSIDQFNKKLQSSEPLLRGIVIAIAAVALALGSLLVAALVMTAGAAAPVITLIAGVVAIWTFFVTQVISSIDAFKVIIENWRLQWENTFWSIEMYIKSVKEKFEKFGSDLQMWYERIKIAIEAFAFVWKSKYDAVMEKINQLKKIYEEFKKYLGLAMEEQIKQHDTWANAFSRGFSTVVGWIKTVVGWFDTLNQKITDLKNRAADKLSKTIMEKAFGFSFATGGVVGGPIGQPTMALVHGGEEITPYNKRESGGGGSGVTFEVNIGMYAGSEVEKRNIASDLYASLVRVAQSQNVTVAELLGA